MAFGKKKKIKEETITVIEETKKESPEVKSEVKINEEKLTEVKETKKSIKKNAKVVVNGRCFGSSLLECPMKTVRNYETKILDIDKEHNSILIDEGWISINNIK